MIEWHLSEYNIRGSSHHAFDPEVLQHDFQSMDCCHAGIYPDSKCLLAMKLEELENLSGGFDSIHIVRTVVCEMAGGVGQGV